MKKIAALSLFFITVLTQAQESPATYFRNYTGTVTISKKEAMEMDTFKVHLKDSKIDMNKFVVVSYDFTVVVDSKATNTNVKTLASKGNSLSTEAKELLKQVVAGSKVFVDNVSATDSKGKTVKASGITFKVQ